MSTADAHEISDILDRVKSWSPPLRITLVRRIMESLESPPVSDPPRPQRLGDLIGLLKVDGPPPSDEECRAIIEEERAKKYLR